ncbi:MAG: chromosome segregation ATPase, partial [Merismopedia sp. SIO2A8]|nr:chromosome segregation ATPase [Merismopedia sp. SIO2A8]
MAAPGTTTQEVIDQVPQEMEATSTPRQRSLPHRILTHWLFWMTTAIAVTGGIGGYAGVKLLTLPSLPNCPNIFWPTASASLRMQCADLAADKNTARDLLKAIALVDALPDSHPMRSQVDASIEQWALDILDLAEVSFHNGDLEGAISSAKRIPIHLSAYEQVDSRIAEWQSIWDKAEDIYQQAEDLLEQEDLRGAFAVAIRLLRVQNDYWKTEQYNQLTGLIETSRVDTAKLNEARQLAKGGDVSALLEAMALAEEIQPDSRLYVSARRTLSRFLDDLVALGIKALERGDATTTMQVARNLPTGVEFQAQAQDFRELSFALSQAEGGTIEDLESAIAQAKALRTNRPLYDKAQDLISYWELEIQDVRYLTRARELARLGQIPDLQAAIAEAQLIRYNNPRGDEAQVAIREWTREIQTRQDRPYLRDARQIAERGGVRALEAAIQQIEGISDDRPLYSEAQQLINEWTDEIETIQDQPYLNDATQFAARGNLPAAIAAAQQIRSGRVLYDEAQSNIRQWQDQINGEIFLREAYDTAQRGNPSAWARAIRTADRISADHANRTEADRLINRWSQNILAQAQRVAQVNYEEAITIANLIPSQVGVYTEAQLQI